MPGSVIVAGARTPIGKLSGALGSFAATDLGGFAIAAALERAGVAPDQVDYVFMGQVIQAGAGQITARQAAANAGIPMSVARRPLNKVCLSGLNTIYLADLHDQRRRRRHRGGRRHGVHDPGPLPAPGARAGYRIGDGTLVDSMMYDGLFCAFDKCAMGLGTERYNGADGVSRERQDAFSALSHERAAAAIKDGQVRRGDRPGRACPSARATPCGRHRRGRPARHHGRVPRQAAARPSTRRDHHRRQRLARSPTAAPPSSSCPGPRPRSWA